MKEKLEKLIKEIEAAHDWIHGQTWSGGGTYLSRSSRCQLCGLVWAWRSDHQNGLESEHRFYDRSGADLLPSEATTCDH